MRRVSLQMFEALQALNVNFGSNVFFHAWRLGLRVWGCEKLGGLGSQNPTARQPYQAPPQVPFNGALVVLNFNCE